MPSDIACPYGCDCAVAIRLEDDTITYATGNSEPLEVAVRVPVYHCERCGEGWTDWRAEDIRQDAWAKVQAET